MKTLEEVQKYRYGKWAGNPAGKAYNPEKCAYEVYHNMTGTQCLRKPGYGPGELYCHQHAKKQRS